MEFSLLRIATGGNKCSGNVNYSYLLVLKWGGLTRKLPQIKGLGLFFFNCQSSMEIDEELK